MKETSIKDKQDLDINVIGNKGNFLLVSKYEKNLKTEDILNLATEFFRALDTVSSPVYEENGEQASLTNRHKAMKDLAMGLRQYSKRLYHSRPWYAKIAAFFGYRSDVEKRVDQMVQQMLPRVNQLQKIDRELKAVHHRSIFSHIPTFSSFKDQFPLLYSTNSENSLWSRLLSRLPFKTACESVIDLLTAGQRLLPSRTIIDALIFARNIDSLRAKMNDQSLAEVVLKNIQNLEDPAENGERNYLIYPARYSSGEPGAYISVERVSRDKFKVIILEKRIAQEANLDDDEKDTLLTKKLKAKVYQFNNVTAKDLTVEFLKESLVKADDSKEELRGFDLSYDADLPSRGNNEIRMLFGMIGLLQPVEKDLVKRFYNSKLMSEVVTINHHQVWRVVAHFFPALDRLINEAESDRDSW